MSQQTVRRQCQVVDKEKIQSMCDWPNQTGCLVVEPSQELYKLGFPVRVVHDCDAILPMAEAHPHQDDLWLCVSGRALFCIGGKLDGERKMGDDGKTVLAPGIVGGRDIVLEPGHWLHIPAGQPHRHGAQGLACLLIIKIPPPEGEVSIE